MSRNGEYLRGLFCALALGCLPVRTLDAVGADLDQSIQRVRTGTLVVQAAPGVEVRVEQVRHEFWFGAALASQFFGGRTTTEEAARYKKAFLENFNAAVTENALKWHAMERRRGEVDYSIVEAMLQWTNEHDIPLRGHNIFWGVPNMVQPWLKGLSDAELRATLKARALDVGRRWRGRFAEYDLNNEMLHGNYYEDRLGPGITREMALWVRQEDPAAVLYLNDYDILTGRRLDDYVAQIRYFRTRGRVDDPLHGERPEAEGGVVVIMHGQHKRGIATEFCVGGRGDAQRDARMPSCRRSSKSTNRFRFAVGPPGQAPPRATAGN